MSNGHHDFLLGAQLHEVEAATQTTNPEEKEPAFVWENPETPITVDDFVIQNGKRFVRPYFFEFIAHVKKRWDGKTIANLFAEEFRQRPLEYYVQAVDAGRILVNGKKVTNEYVVRSSQTLSHFVHRHEPPVMDGGVEILEFTEDVLTVCKPSSVPVHPCGQYRKNTVLGILQAERELGSLYPIHRLDRLVSGLLIFARNAHTADRFRQEIEAGAVNKCYIARVQGVFPDNEVELNAAVTYDAREGKSKIEEPINQAAKMGTVIITAENNLSELQFKKGKWALTRFKRVHTDGLHSIVECKPLTGRTHQIRVHLQYLGHPIANDALYATRDPPKRTEVGTNAERAARLDFEGSIIDSCATADGKRRRVDTEESHADESQYGNKLKGSCSLRTKLDSYRHDIDFLKDPMCTHCPELAPSGYEGEEHGLWLHCKSYEGEGWKYECPLPKWTEL